MGLTEELAKGGIQSNEGISTISPFSFSDFAPVLSAGSGVFSALRGDAKGALSGGSSLLGGAVGGPVGALAGAAIAKGIGSISSKFGSSETIRPGLGPVDFSSFKDTFLEGVPLTFGGAVGPTNSFDNLSTELANQIQFISPAIQREVDIFKSLGLSSIADDLVAEQKRLFNPSPSSPAAGRAQNQNLQNLLGTTIKLRGSILETAQSNPEFSSQFESNTGTSISDFVGQLRLDDQKFAKGFNLRAGEADLGRASFKANRPTQSRIDTGSTERSRVVDDLGFEPVFRGAGSNRKLSEFRRLSGRGKEEIISIGEFNKRSSAALAEFDETTFGDINRSIAGINDFLNTPDIDISPDVKGQFGGLFNTFAGGASSVIAGGGGAAPSQPGQGPGAIQPTEPTQPGVDKTKVAEAVGKAARSFLRIPRRKDSLSGGGFFGGGFTAGDQFRQDEGDFTPSGFISKLETSPRLEALNAIT